MAIQGISSGFNAYAASLQAGQTQQSAQNQDTAPVEQREPTPQERVEAKEEQPPRPVTNAEGQTTGTLINVTA